MAQVTEEKKIPFLRKITPYEQDGVKDKAVFLLGNGQSVEVALEEISAENRIRAMWHGISQRLGDACANLSKDKAYGAAFEVLQELKEQLGKKEWTREREGSSAGRQQLEDLIAALAKLKKQPEDVIRTAVGLASEDKRKVWMKNSAIALEMANIKRDRLKAEAKGSNQTIDDVDLGI